jgi:2-oxoglutarate ferredoxin oxidoreductase subunit beta
VIKSEVVIDERRCRGCGYCVQFCPNHCLEISSEHINKQGYFMPVVVKEDLCSRCGACAWMCPHWAIEVYSRNENHTIERERVAGPPRLASDPPLAGCPGCQHPVIGHIVADVLDELGAGDNAVIFDAIPCAMSSAFGMDFGRKLSFDESAFDLATDIRRTSPDAVVLAVQGYWGLSDFSFDIGALIGALIRNERFTTILCNMPYYAPKHGRPSPSTEPAGGRMEPVTRINTPEGQKILNGGYLLHIAELVAQFKGVVYSARGTLSSLKDYRSTREYIKSAIQKQMNGGGFSFVEVLAVCSDFTYSDPPECIQWIQDNMITEFPCGVFIDK